MDECNVIFTRELVHTDASERPEWKLPSAYGLSFYGTKLANPPSVESQVLFLRRSGSAFKGKPLFRESIVSQLGPVVFAPVSDLKSISQAGLEGRSQLGVTKRSNAGVTISGGQILGDEWAEHVVRNRAGIILRARLVPSIFRTW